MYTSNEVFYYEFWKSKIIKLKQVFFHTADKSLNIKGKTSIKLAVINLFKKEKKVLERLDYIFCSDRYLLQINKDFLQHDYYTDIITFDLSESTKIKGEIYISLDRVKDNSTNHNTSYTDEVLRVIFHGALHLCGYKDKKKKEIQVMREKEQYYLDNY